MVSSHVAIGQDVQVCDMSLPCIDLDVEPSFPGGEEARIRYLSDNLIYPPADLKAGISGTVYLRFLVGRDGTVHGVHVVSGVSPGLDSAAVHVAELMPAWSPGLIDDWPVTTMLGMPIVFATE